MEPEQANHGRDARMTQARDVMTAQVTSVGPDEPVRDIAKLLLDKGISAVPVVDGENEPIGMVSEGDLIGRGEGERLARRDWWLTLVTGKQALDDEFRARLQGKNRTARDVMTAPVVTVTEQTDLREVARLLASHRIKRVPVVRDNRLVGIVARADLLRLVAAGDGLTATPGEERRPGLLGRLFGSHSEPEPAAAPPADAEASEPAETGLTAHAFQHLVEDFHGGETRQREETRRAAAEFRRKQTAELIDAHVFDGQWRDMLHHAQEAAESGEVEYLLLRFPNELCIDGGRAINVAEHDWPSTLRGEPAEVYLRWERDLKPRGFSLSARVLEYPGGKPGDIGLFLAWGSRE